MQITLRACWSTWRGTLPCRRRAVRVTGWRAAGIGDREVRLIPDEAAVSPRGPESPRPREEMSIVAGSFVRLDCLGAQARMDLAVRGETVSLLIDSGGLVVIKGSGTSKVDLRCGEQKPRSVVVRFIPRKIPSWERRVLSAPSSSASRQTKAGALIKWDSIVSVPTNRSRLSSGPSM